MITTEIQHLIDEAFAKDSDDIVTVDLPAGTHKLDAPLRLKPHVHLRGVGDQTVLETKNKDINFIELDPGHDAAAHDIEISNLHLKGPGTSPDITQDASIDPMKGCGILVATQGDGKEVRNVVIQGCRIENVSGCGLLFHTQDDVLMKDITVKNCQFHQNRRQPDTLISGQPGKPQSYKDIFFYGTRFENIHLEGNTCSFTPKEPSLYGNDSGIAFVINQVHRRGCFVRNSRLIDNTCSGHRRHGIVTNYSAMAAFDVEVRGNTCRDNRWAGIYVNTDVEEGENVTIEDNVCDHNGYGGSSDPTADDKSIRGGIVLSGCYNSQINNNRCANNGRPSSGFGGADASAKGAAGILVRGKNLVLEGNKTENNEGGAIVEWQEHDESVKIIEAAADITPAPPAVKKPAPVSVVKKPAPAAEKKKKKGCLFAFLPF